MFLVLLLTLLGISVALFALSELQGFIKIQNYKKQGIKHAEYRFLPAKLLEVKKLYKSKDFQSKRKKQFMEFDHNQPFSVESVGSRCYVTLLSSEAIKQFFAKELEVSIKIGLNTEVDKMGFFNKNGKIAEEQRAIFAKIFHYSNIVKLMPDIRSVIKQHVGRLKRKVSEAGGVLKINFEKDFNSYVFDDLTGCILLGGAQNKVQQKFDGMTITQAIQKMFYLSLASNYSLINKLPFAGALGLNKEVNEIRRLQGGVIEIVKKLYKEAYNQKDKKLSDKNLLEIMIGYYKLAEKKGEKPKFSLKDISANFEIFQFAASDTSNQLSTTTITLLALAENKHYQRRIRNEIETKFSENQNYTTEQLAELEEVDLVFKEALRMASSTSMISERVAIKDFDLCGCKVKKGDNLRHFLLGHQPAYFEDPQKFNPERFRRGSSECKMPPKMKFTPFSLGRRSCIGRYLGELMFKLILVELVKEVEVGTEPGFVPKFGMNPLYGIKNSELIVRLRIENGGR